MARDYANNNRYKSKSSRRSEGGSVRPWVVTGILIGIVIAGLAYMKIRGAHMLNEQMADANKPSRTVEQKAPPPTKAPEPHFDFYTVLSKDSKTSVATDVPDAKPKPTNPAVLLPPDMLPEEEKATEAKAKSESKAEQVPVSEKSSEKEPPVTTVNVETGQVEAAKPETSSREQMLAEEKQRLEQEIAQAAQQAATATNKTAAVNVTKHYILVMGAFKDHTAADEKRAQLALQGFEANVKKIQKDGGILYRVWIGPYSSLKSAQQQQHRLQASQITSVLVKE